MQHSVFLTCNFLQKVLAKNNNTNYTIYTERSSTKLKNWEDILMINLSISERGNKLKEQFFENNPGICSERAKIVTQAHKDFIADPAVI